MSEFSSDPTTARELGARLRQFRLLAGLTQEQVMKRAGRRGKGRASVASRLETGKMRHVSVGLVADCLCFGREMWSKGKAYSGETYAIEAQVLLDKWVARGLTQSVLESIRTDVFNTGAPTPPPP